MQVFVSTRCNYPVIYISIRPHTMYNVHTHIYVPVNDTTKQK